MLLLGEFDPLVDFGLRKALADAHITIHETAVAEPSLTETVRRETPDVVLVDSTTDLLLLNRLQSESSSAIAVLAHDPPESYGRCLLALGISCIAAGLPLDVLRLAVRRAATGTRLAIVSGPNPGSWRHLEYTVSLSPREAEVLVMLSAGSQYTEIMHALGISIPTARTYATQICDKLALERKKSLFGILVAPLPRA